MQYSLNMRFDFTKIKIAYWEFIKIHENSPYKEYLEISTPIYKVLENKDLSSDCDLSGQ